MNQRRPGRAPDFTTASLIMLGVNMTWVFFLLWALYGLIPVLVLATLIHHLINRIDAARRSSDGPGRL